MLLIPTTNGYGHTNTNARSWNTLMRFLKVHQPDMYFLALIIFAEVGNAHEGFDSKLAVGWVVRNRLESGNKYFCAKSYKSVVACKYSGKQFHGYNSGEWDKFYVGPGKSISTKSVVDFDAMLSSLIAAGLVLYGGNEADITGGAKYFKKRRRKKVIRGRVFGSHVFRR